MRIVFFSFFLLFFLVSSTILLAQQDDATIFFSRVPDLVSSQYAPGNPCENAVEFNINKNEKKIVNLQGANAVKEKGKTKLNVSETGNKTVWYKIHFDTDCDLSFRIYSDKASDIYHYFVFKQNDDIDFCRKLSEKKLTPMRANMLEHKQGITGTGISDGTKINYKDMSENYLKRILFHTPFLDAIKAKAGETYYINVYHTEGTDSYHYFVLSACFREVNLKTENDNLSEEQVQIIEKLPEHVTKTQSNEETDSLAVAQQAEAKAKKKAVKENEERAKAEAEAKKNLKSKKDAVKKISPQLQSFGEKDTLNQYLMEGKVIYEKGPRGPVVEGEIYISNTDGSVTVLKKMYTNDSGMFRFANLPLEHDYHLSMNASDNSVEFENELSLSGTLFLKGEPAEGVLINNTAKTGADGSFTLGTKELLSLNVNELFNRWNIDLTDPAQYAEALKKYGGISVANIVYRIQVGAYKEEKNFDYSHLNDLGKVEKKQQSDGITRFVIGEFNTLGEADNFKKKVFAKGINDAFILVYFNGTKKFLEEVIEKNMLKGE